jgi:nucleoid-associated protein YgaU
MGLFDFMRNAGKKVLHGKDDVEDVRRYLTEHGVSTRDVTVMVDGGKVTLMGWVPTIDIKEKTVLLAGNIEGIAKVDDRLHVGVRPGATTVPNPATTAAAKPAAPHVPGSTLGTGTGKVALSPDETAGSSAPQWQSRTYTVEKGDTLSQIARKFYGDASDYPLIFEANKPMLSDPDKIYPGQVLRIPAQRT